MHIFVLRLMWTEMISFFLLLFFGKKILLLFEFQNYCAFLKNGKTKIKCVIRHGKITCNWIWIKKKIHRENENVQNLLTCSLLLYCEININYLILFCYVFFYVLMCISGAYIFRVMRFLCTWLDLEASMDSNISAFLQRSWSRWLEKTLQTRLGKCLNFFFFFVFKCFVSQTKCKKKWENSLDVLMCLSFYWTVYFHLLLFL